MGVHWILPASGAMPGYRLISRRGGGGFAEVYEAEAPGGFRVALKLVRPSAQTRDRELRAIEIIRAIRHPHLLALFGAWQVEGYLIIGMELADRSLFDRFLEARSQGLRGIPRRELLGYLSCAAAGIDYLNGYRHTIEGRPAVGIQHRDLKPENILLFGETAKVADFGMVRLMEASFASHTGTWTLPYAAPEFFRKQTACQSDQYALAVTYCQLRGGRLPFRGSTAEIVGGHMFGAPDLEGLPEPEQQVVARALSKCPEARWPDCRAFIEALRSLERDEEGAVPDLLMLQEPEEPEAPDGFSRTSGENESSFVTADIRLTTDTLEYPSAYGDSIGDRDNSPGGGVRGSAVAGSSGKVSGRSWGRWATMLLAAGLALGASLVLIPPGRPLRATPPVEMALMTALLRCSGADAVVGALAIGFSGKAIPAGPTSPVREPAFEPPAPPERSPQGPAGIEAEMVARLAESRNYHSDEGHAAVEPIRFLGSEPVIVLPDPVILRAGAQARLRVRVSRGETEGPLDLQFRGTLPQGVDLRCPTIPAGAETAEAVVSASAEATPGDSEVAVALAARPDQTAARFQVRILPAPAKAAFESGRADFLRGAYKQAVAEFTEAIQLDPKHAEAHFARGLANHLNRDYRAALADYTEAIRCRPDHADSHLLQGRVHQELGFSDKALADYTEAIRLRPGDAAAYLARGRVHHESGDYDKALADLDEAIRLRPNDSTVHYLRGLVRYHAGDHARAIADFNAVIQLDPKHAHALRSRSEAYARLGERARAAADHDMFNKLFLGQAPLDPSKRPTTHPAQSSEAKSSRATPITPRFQTRR